ncbi:unnamed protein product [Allacma fusca]|uniref:CLIP domain-containing serine protease n=1 Tax=Allacma fusca TaxID=39272 RepID=A0A8J2JN92_9HEXA|nr:unnamed protein product [Allacma fusca]
MGLRTSACRTLCLVLYLINVSQGVPSTKGEFCYSKHDEEGQCVPFDSCLPYLKILKERPISKSDLRLVVNLTCTFDNYEPLICCPLKDIYSNPLNELNNRRAKPLHPVERTFKHHRNFPLLPSASECSNRKGTNLLGNGSKVGRGEFPWSALIGYLNPSTGIVEFLCGGTVINNRYILTAAHCVRKTGGLKPSVVRLAEHDLVNDPDCSNSIGHRRLECSFAKDMKIEKIISHYKYEHSETSYFQHNDIALVRLSENIDFNDFVQPICLPFTSEYGMHKYPGKLENTTGLTAGWGKSMSSQHGSTVIRAVPLPIKSKEDCSAYYFTRSEITRDQICAGGGTIQCGGDSGGSLMIPVNDNFATPKLVQIGVTTFGPTYCSHGVPSIYTRITSYLNWILDTIKP